MNRTITRAGLASLGALASLASQAHADIEMIVDEGIEERQQSFVEPCCYPYDGWSERACRRRAKTKRKKKKAFRP